MKLESMKAKLGTALTLLKSRLRRREAGPGLTRDPDEQAIQDLVTASHILANEGILDSFGHVSVRSSRNPKHFFIPRAMPPALVTRGDIVEVGENGAAIAPDAPRLNGERYIHSEIYKARPDVHSVIHTHDHAVIPFGIAGTPLRPVVVQAGFLPPVSPVFEIRDLCGHLPAHGMLVTTPELGRALAEKLGSHPVVLMRGHGNTVVGRSVREATVRTIYTHIDARAQFAGMQLNPEVIALSDAELAFNAKENFDAGRPWENYRMRMLRARPAR